MRLYNDETQMTESVSLADFADWRVENFRLTIFHAAASAASGLWERVMGVSPETVDSRPREHVLREQGNANGNNLLLVTQPQRLDWTVLPDPSSDRWIGLPPTLMAEEQSISLLQRALATSLESLRQVDRLAFGTVLIQQVSDLNEGMVQLSRFLPQMDLAHRGGSDFIYQINRRRRSSHSPHVLINRLAKWQMEEFQSGALRITPAQGPQLHNIDSGFVIKLVLDINTVPGNNAISVDRMPGLFVELAAFAREIATEGDVQ